VPGKAIIVVYTQEKSSFDETGELLGKQKQTHKKT